LKGLSRAAFARTEGLGLALVAPLALAVALVAYQTLPTPRLEPRLMAQFATDTFTDTADTALASHAGETGATWTRSTMNATGDLRITAGGRVRPNTTTGGGSFYTASGTPGGTNYGVQAGVYVAGTHNNGYAGVVLRNQGGSGAEKNYWAIYNGFSGAWELWETPSGAVSAAQIGSGVSATLTAGQTYTLRLAVVGSLLKVYVDGVEIISTSDATVTGTGTAGIVGYGTWTDSTGLHLDNFRADDVKLCVCDGDSLTEGYGLSTPATQSYPAQLGQLLGVPWVVVNKGAGGQTCAQIEADASSDVDPLYHATNNADNVLIAFAGTNDIYFNADTSDAATTTIGRVETYCGNRQAAGWRVLVGTLLPRSDFPGTSTLPADKETHHEARRQAVNTSLRANWSTYADRLIDFAADTRIGDDGDEDDTTYYLADKVHPNATGAGVLAALAQMVILNQSVAAVIYQLTRPAWRSPYPIVES
jgi:lysophospholipase L1-like esterase